MRRVQRNLNHHTISECEFILGKTDFSRIWILHALRRNDEHLAPHYPLLHGKSDMVTIKK
jgi:hypothetical protein